MYACYTVILLSLLFSSTAHDSFLSTTFWLWLSTMSVQTFNEVDTTTGNSISADLHDEYYESRSGSNTVAAQPSRSRGVRRLKSASVMNPRSIHRNRSFQLNSVLPSSNYVAAAVGSCTRDHRALPDRSCSARSLHSNDVRSLNPPSVQGIDHPPAAANRGTNGPRNRVVLRTSSSSNYGSGTPGILSRSRLAPPSRGLLASSSSGGLIPFRHDQIVNLHMENRINPRMATAARGGFMQRQVSGDLNDSKSHSCVDDAIHSVVSDADCSLVTMDSIFVRKGQQMIADPLDDKSFMYVGDFYGEDECSFADHDTYVTSSINEEFGIVEEMSQPNDVLYNNQLRTVLSWGNAATPDSRHFSEQMNQICITENHHSSDDHSQYSMASGLTNDFNEFAIEDDDHDNDDYVDDGIDDDVITELEDSSDDDDIGHRHEVGKARIESE
jgi:hypothetical protein